MSKKLLPEKWVVNVCYEAGSYDYYRSWAEPVFVCDTMKAAILVAKSHMKTVVKHLRDKPERNRVIARINQEEGRMVNGTIDVIAEY